MSEPQEPAVYLDGEPQNLAAAAWDALGWLLWLRDSHGLEWGVTLPGSLYRRSASWRDEHATRLERTLNALREYLVPHLPAEFRESAETKGKNE